MLSWSETTGPSVGRGRWTGFVALSFPSYLSKERLSKRPVVPDHVSVEGSRSRVPERTGP